MDPFVAEIRIFGFNFAPKGWAFCSGQLLAITQNTALFSLLGTTYGGDGKSTFGLPNLEGSAPIHAGQAVTGTDYFLGQQGGVETVALLQSEIPQHTHGAGVQTAPLGGVALPSGTTGLGRPASGNLYFDPPGPPANPVLMDPNTLAPAGSGFPHTNLQPYLVLNFCIAMQGVFPPRS